MIGVVATKKNFLAILLMVQNSQRKMKLKKQEGMPWFSLPLKMNSSI